MVTWINHGFLDLLFFVSFLQSSHTYNKRCPVMVELEVYPKQKCSKLKEYHCLAIDGNKYNNREECRTPEWVSKGNFPVFRGIYIDYETCPADSYQPYLFRSNERYKCVYQRSSCSSEGQIEVNDGNATSDKACRCNNNRGFAFVIRPRNICACIPSKEDCSCYRKSCIEGYKLNPEYHCSSKTELPGSSNCQTIILTTETTRVDVPLNIMVSNNTGAPKVYSVRQLLFLAIIVMVALLLLSFSCVCCLYKPEDEERQTVKQYKLGLASAEISKRNNKTDFTFAITKSEEEKKQQIFNKEIDEHKRYHISENCSKRGFQRTITSTKKNDKVATVSQGHVEQCATRKSIQYTDIVILHLLEDHQRKEVESFKSHLKLLSTQMSNKSVSIKLFEEIYPTEQNSSGVEIETVLEMCCFVFVYISKNFMTSKLKRLGLKESSIMDVLEGSESETQIKIVSNCKFWDLPHDRYLSIKQDNVNFDYSNFVDGSTDDRKNYKEKFENVLAKIHSKKIKHTQL